MLIDINANKSPAPVKIDIGAADIVPESASPNKKKLKVKKKKTRKPN
jgi:hypothetical protein